jgi:hypothetical protein
MAWRRVSIAAVLAAAVLLPGAARAAEPAQALSGQFAITPGSCDGGPSGSYFRMILPTGTASGPFVSNSDSACGDQSYTLLSPGADGGLIVGTYQSEPSPAFDSSGNSLANRITEPTKFFGRNFSTSTNGTDPQTGTSVPAPVLSGADGALSGDLRSFGASWNNQEFNQGAPKPDGSSPGLTAAPAGTLDGSTGAYTLEWTSQIVGGPFDKFTGLWHLEGTFTPTTTPTTASNEPSADSNVNPALTASGAQPGGSTATTAPPSPTSALSAVPGQAGPATAKSPNVVIARSGGGSSGNGWLLVAIPVGLVGLAAAGIALRARALKQRAVEPSS